MLEYTFSLANFEILILNIGSHIPVLSILHLFLEQKMRPRRQR